MVINLDLYLCYGFTYQRGCHGTVSWIKIKTPSKCHGSGELLVSQSVSSLPTLLGFVIATVEVYKLNKIVIASQKTSTNKSLSAICLHLGCHLNTHTKQESDIAATETDILWECNLNSRAIQAKLCLCYVVCLNMPSPRSLTCVAMQALFIQGPICLYVPTYTLNLSLALNFSQQQNSLLE